VPAAEGATVCVCRNEGDKKEAGGTADFPPGPQKKDKQATRSKQGARQVEEEKSGR
jgi:hypothetical protein